MQLWICFAALAAVILILLYIPDLFPLCSCCGKKKFKPFISIHRVIGINPGYSGSRSVCKRCSREYNIESFGDLDRLIEIKRKMKIDSLSR